MTSLCDDHAAFARGRPNVFPVPPGKERISTRQCGNEPAFASPSLRVSRVRLRRSDDMSASSSFPPQSSAGPPDISALPLPKIPPIDNTYGALLIGTFIGLLYASLSRMLPSYPQTFSCQPVRGVAPSRIPICTTPHVRLVVHQEFRECAFFSSMYCC